MTKTEIPKTWTVFFDEQSGGKIHRDRFYGFADAGGLAGDFDGYTTREACLNACTQGWMGPVGSKPEELGEHAVCVLSGEEFVNRLSELDDVSVYGKFCDHSKEDTVNSNMLFATYRCLDCGTLRHDPPLEEWPDGKSTTDQV